MNADLILLMHKGKIDEMGTHEELMKLKGRYYGLISKQGIFKRCIGSLLILIKVNFKKIKVN